MKKLSKLVFLLNIALWQSNIWGSDFGPFPPKESEKRVIRASVIRASTKYREVEFLDIKHRPQEINEEIEKTFKSISELPVSKKGLRELKKTHYQDPKWSELYEKHTNWIYDGRPSYEIMGIDCLKLSMDLVRERAKSDKSCVICDVGSGDGEFGETLAEEIEKLTDLPEGFHVHILNLTGENYKQELTTEKKHSTIYNLDAFEIENLKEAFQKRQLPFEGKVDLAVSALCFIHLHDVPGTFIQLYDLLKPRTGLMLVSDLPLLIEGSTDVREKAEDFLHHTGVPCILGPKYDNAVPFLIQRKDESPLRLPFAYSGSESYWWASSSKKDIAVIRKLPEKLFPVDKSSLEEDPEKTATELYNFLCTISPTLKLRFGSLREALFTYENIISEVYQDVLPLHEKK